MVVDPPGFADPPRWVFGVIAELVDAWRVTWEQQPPELRSVSLAANIAAIVVATWALAAEPAQLRELAADPTRDPRPQAIGALVGVVLPCALEEEIPT